MRLSMEQFKMKKDSVANCVMPILILLYWISEVALPFKDEGLRIRLISKKILINGKKRKRFSFESTNKTKCQLSSTFEFN